MGETLQVGAIGTGGIWNGAHVRGWDAIPTAKLVAACDIVESKARAFAEPRGIEHVYADYRDLLKLDQVEAVDICTSNKFHSEIAVAALEAGKHVLCEKPDAISVAEAQRMVDAAKASGKLLLPMRNNRFTAGSTFLKACADADRFGEVYTGRCGWVRRRGIPGKGGWFTTKALSGGGPLIDLGVHMIDLAIWLMGNPRPVTVVGSTYRKFATDTVAADSAHAGFGESKADGIFDVEDLASGFIKFDNGASLQIEFSWASNVEEEKNFVELRGTKGGFAYDGGETKIFTEIEGTLCDIHPRFGKSALGGHARAIRHFVDVIQDGVQPIVTPSDGLHMIKILTAIYQSAESGKEVTL